MAAKKQLKMTEYKTKLFAEVLIDEEYHKEHFANEAVDNMAMLRGDTSYMPSSFGGEVIDPNLIFSTVRTYVPALYPQNPKISAKPEGPSWGPKKRDNVYSAFIAENVLNYYQRTLEMKTTDKMAILGGLAHGIAYVMDCWGFEPNNTNPIMSKDRPIHRFVSGVDLIPSRYGLEFEDKPHVTRCFAKSFEEMRRLNYQNMEAEDDGKLTGIDEVTKLPKLPKFYEVWDKVSETVYVFSQNGGSESSNHDERPFDIAAGFPFTPLILNPMIDNFYPMSLVQVLKVMQKFMTLMVSYGAKHAKMAVPKYAGFKSFLDQQAIEALKSGEIQDFIPLTDKMDDKRTIDQIIGVLKLPALPPDYYNMVNIVRDLMNVISGVSENARGGGQQNETATGAAIVDTYLRSRMGDYKGIVDDFIISSRRKMLKVIKKNASKDKYLRFNKVDLYSQYFYPKPKQAPQGTTQMEFAQKSSPVGDFVFIPWNKNDISDEYDLVLGTGAGLPPNEESAYKKALQNFNIMANFPGFDKTKVGLQFLRDIGVPNPEQVLAPPPPPPKPEPPKRSISVTVNAKDMPPEFQAGIMDDLGMGQESPAMNGGESSPGKTSPINVGLQRELGVAGLPAPPTMPELPKRRM